MAGERRPTTRSARKRGERERAAGLDDNDEAARWLDEHDPEPPPAAPKAASKSKGIHQWRQRGGGKPPA